MHPWLEHCLQVWWHIHFCCCFSYLSDTTFNVLLDKVSGFEYKVEKDVSVPTYTHFCRKW